MKPNKPEPLAPVDSPGSDTKPTTQNDPYTDPYTLNGTIYYRGGIYELCELNRMVDLLGGLGSAIDSIGTQLVASLEEAKACGLPLPDPQRAPIWVKLPPRAQANHWETIRQLTDLVRDAEARCQQDDMGQPRTPPHGDDDDPTGGRRNGAKQEGDRPQN